MKHFPAILLLGAVAALPVAVHAAASTDNPTGPYVGAGIGQFNVNIQHFDDVDNALQSIRKSDDTSWKVFAGYRFLPYLGVEAAYIDFGQPNDQFTATGSHGNYRVKMNGFAPSLIGRVPLGPVELFAKIGQLYYDVDTRIDFDAPGPDIHSKHSRNDFIWGGGIAAVVASRLELRAEYEKVEIDNFRDSDALWLNAAWRF